MTNFTLKSIGFNSFVLQTSDAEIFLEGNDASALITYCRLFKVGVLISTSGNDTCFQFENGDVRYPEAKVVYKNNYRNYAIKISAEDFKNNVESFGGLKFA